MHHYLLRGIIALLDSQFHWTRWLRLFNNERLNVQKPHSSFVAIFHSYFYLFNLLQKYRRKAKNILIWCAIPKKKPYSKLRNKTYKRPRKTKRPPTIDRSEQLTLFRESRPTPPTTVIFPLSQRPTSFQNTVSINFCSDWSARNNRHYTPTFDRTKTRLLAAKTSLPTVARGSAAGRPRNFVRPWAPPPHNPFHLFGPSSLRPSFSVQGHQPY